MSVNYGSKRIVVGAHYGLRDWLSQRVTAAVMAIFTVMLLAQLLLSKGPHRLRQVVRHLCLTNHENINLCGHFVPALARLGWHARRLHGLRQARSRSLVASGFYDCLARGIFRLGRSSFVALLRKS